MKKVIELIDFVPNLDIIKIDIPKLVTCIYKEMPMNIKEIRYKTGLSQREFSNMFSIPLSTLQKWEQGESSPSPYVVSLIANQLPINTDSLYRIEDNKGKI